jgi:integrase
MSDRKSLPSYRLHKQSGQGVVTLTDGTGQRRDVLLGKHGTAESRREYLRVLGEWEASGRRLPEMKQASARTDLSVNELLLAYWRHVETYYVKDGKPTSEQDVTRQALRFVKECYGQALAKDFGPNALKAVRQRMIDHPILRKRKVKDLETGEVRTEEYLLRQGLARKVINKHVGRIKRMFGWAVEEELLPASVHAALLRVQGLRKGKGQGREKSAIKSVPQTWIEAVWPHLPVVIRAMVEVQRLTGARPHEVVEMLLLDIDRRGPVWEYRPARHKTQHLDRERIVFLGPRAQQVLQPWLPSSLEAWIFSPARSVALRNEKRHRERISPLTAARTYRRKARPKRVPRERYDVASYRRAIRRAIRRACLEAGIPVWHPNQIRHARATEVRKLFGLEAAQAVLGHAELGVTQVYAEKDLETARRVVAEIG